MYVNDPAQPPIVGHYIQPPFSVIDRRKGEWRKRTKWWRNTLPDDAQGRTATVNPSTGIMSLGDGISRFDPTLAEIFYRWWTRPSDHIYDPFAGGPTRGLVATAMGRTYHGIDISPTQIAANQKHCDLWTLADSTAYTPEKCDAVFTCPPYWGLERYSDDPRDLSNRVHYREYLDALSSSLSSAVSAMRHDRYIGIVISDVRDKAGAYVGLPGHTMDIIRSLGCSVIVDAAVVDPVGTKYLIGWKLLGQSRKLQRTHQYLIVAVKGDVRKAAERLCSPGMHKTPVGGRTGESP